MKLAVEQLLRYKSYSLHEKKVSGNKKLKPLVEVPMYKEKNAASGRIDSGEGHRCMHQEFLFLVD